MTTLKGVKSNPIGYTLGAIDVLFKDKDDLVQTLDPRKADEDNRIQVIKSECLVCLICQKRFLSFRWSSD